MPGMPHRPRRAGRAATAVAVTLLSAGLLAVVAPAAGATAVQAAVPKTFVPKSGYTVKDPPTAQQVNTSVQDGVDYVDCQQDQTSGDTNEGSFDGDVPETAAAIIAYGVLARGSITNLPTKIDDPACPGTSRNFQADLTAAVNWMLGQQDTSAPTVMGDGGSWSYGGGDQTYSTGLALAGFGLIETAIPALTKKMEAAVALGRTFLADEQQVEPNPNVSGQTACTTTPNLPADEDDSYYCGGWDYNPGSTTLRSDESNTGYAMTGLHLTGGLTDTEKKYNLGWQTNDQADETTNPYWADGGATLCGTPVPHNDGGGSYQPEGVGLGGYCWPSDFSSNANDSGSLLFGFAYDGLTISDPRVDKALQFDTDVLDTYEKTANSVANEGGPHTMVAHDGAQEDGSCVAGAQGCDWVLGTGEGGFHYSMFTLAKGMGAFIPADLSDGSNWYSKVADLLVHQQDTTSVCTAHQDQPCTFGSWPADTRDDFTALFATALSVFSLGLVSTPPPPVTSVHITNQQSTCSDITLTWTNPTTPNYGGVFVQRSTTGYPATASDGTRLGDVASPGTTYTDTGLRAGTTYYYALFAHDTTGAEIAPGVDASVTPSCPPGYRLEGGDGGVFDFNQPYHGSVGFPSPPGLGLHIYNFVAMATTSNGYWLAQRNGGVFSFNAPFEGSLPNSDIDVDDIVGIAATPDGAGYWLVSSDGTVYNFGDAHDFGSLSAGETNDVVAIDSPDAGGYWLVGANGAIYAFGDAHFHGSCPTAGSGCTSLASPIVGMSSPDPSGYWLVAADGGVFTFGDAHYYGSCPQSGSGCTSLSSPVIGLAAPDAGGYWLATSDGGIFTFGDAHYYGSCPETGSACTNLVRPIVAINS
jgi:hypothetical protein